MKLSARFGFIFAAISFMGAWSIGCSDDDGKEDSVETECTLTRVGEFVLDGFSSEMVVDGNRVVIAHQTDPTSDPSTYSDPTTYFVYVLDISNPQEPQLIASRETGNWVYAIAVDGNRGYLGMSEYGENQWGGRIEEVDLTDPDLAPLRAFSTEEIPNGFHVKGNYGYLLDLNGINVVDLNTFEIISTVGNLSTYLMAISGDRAYAAGGTNAIEVLDISSPQTPVMMGSLPNPYSGSPHDILVSGNTVALALGGLGVGLFDVANPEQIELLKLFDTSDWAEGLAIRDQFGFLADGDAGLVSLDITEPSEPRVTGICPLDGYTRRVEVSGTAILALTNEKGLSVFENPIE